MSTTKQEAYDLTIELAARHIAAAFGYGEAWYANPRFGPLSQWSRDPSGEGNAGEHLPACVPDLRIRRETETLERANEAMPESEIAKLPPESQSIVRAWQSTHSLTEGQGTNPERVREFEHWKTSPGIGVTPRRWLDSDALGAMAFCKWSVVADAWMRMYALQEWFRWPVVLRAAMSHGYSQIAVEDAATRILLPSRRAKRRAGLDVSQDERALQLGMQADRYRQQTKAAEKMLRDWLLRGAKTFMRSLHSRTANHPADGVIGKRHNVQPCEDSSMKPSATVVEYSEMDRRMLTRALALLEIIVMRETPAEIERRSTRQTLTLVRPQQQFKRAS